MSVVADTPSLLDKLGDAADLIACAKIAAGEEGHGEGPYPVVTTLDVALDKIDDVLEVLNGKAG